MNSSEMARALGKKGGKARAVRLSAAERARIAALGGHARLISLHAARRVAENFRYVAVLDALQPRTKAVRLRNFAGRLPGIYASKVKAATT
jgi:hypothetical protein